MISASGFINQVLNRVRGSVSGFKRFPTRTMVERWRSLLSGSAISLWSFDLDGPTRPSSLSLASLCVAFQDASVARCASGFRGSSPSDIRTSRLIQVFDKDCLWMRSLSSGVNCRSASLMTFSWSSRSLPVVHHSRDFLHTTLVHEHSSSRSFSASLVETGDTTLSWTIMASGNLSSGISDEVILESGTFTAALLGAGLKLLEFG